MNPETLFGRDLGVRGAWSLAGLLIASSLFSGVGAAFPQNTWLQVGPVIIFAALIPWFARRLPLSRTAWAMVTLFVLIHLFAAHWTYSDVPYDRWLGHVGINSAALLKTNRNMFDRLVHFSFGVLVVRPMIEIEVRWAKLPLRPAARVAILFVLASSAVYEIFEWSLAVIMSPGAAEAYNGQQGDAFDAQKDMAMAFVGALLAVPFVRGHLQ